MKITSRISRLSCEVIRSTSYMAIHTYDQSLRSQRRPAALLDRHTVYAPILAFALRPCELRRRCAVQPDCPDQTSARSPRPDGVARGISATACGRNRLSKSVAASSRFLRPLLSTVAASSPLRVHANDGGACGALPRVGTARSTVRAL